MDIFGIKKSIQVIE